MSSGDWADLIQMAYLVLAVGSCFTPFMVMMRRFVGGNEDNSWREPDSIRRGHVPTNLRILSLDRDSEISWPTSAVEATFQSLMWMRRRVATLKFFRFLRNLGILLVATEGLVGWQEWLARDVRGGEETLWNLMVMPAVAVVWVNVALGGFILDRMLSGTSLLYYRSSQELSSGGYLLLRVTFGLATVEIFDPAFLPSYLWWGVVASAVIMPDVLTYLRSDRESRSARTDLLILRVFETKRPAYIESLIEPLWEYIGATFTLVSKSLIRVDRFGLPLLSWLPLMGAVFGSMIVVSELCIWLHQSGGLSVWLILLTAVVHGSLVWLVTRGYLRRQLERVSITSSESIPRNLFRLWKHVGRADRWGRYRHRHVICGEESWRQVVKELVTKCDAILFDFRGFQPENTGLRYELELAFKKVGIEKMLLLTDEKVEETLLHQAVEEAWVKMGPTSPNWGTEERLKVFLVRERVRKADAERIVAWLFRDAVAAPRGG